jgi:hypothetical protein
VRDIADLARRAAALGAIVLLLLGPTFMTPVARADGDPASDVLLVGDVFYPYQPKVSSSLERALEQTLREALRVAGLHLKVAIIGTKADLGLVPAFLGRPQAYAQFLDREISFNEPQQLLVVMPTGYGVMPATLAGGLAGTRVTGQQGSDGLTRSAISAVLALARSQGHPIPAPKISSSSSGGSPPALLVFGIPALLLALGGLVATRRRSHERQDRFDA